MNRPAACNDRASEAALEVDTFMSGLGQQESGNPLAMNKDTGAIGAWQVLPSNWATWASEAGLSDDAPRTAENQRVVVRHKLKAYFTKYGSWDAVARAWYSGRPFWHSDLANYTNGHRYPSVNAYASGVLAKVGALPCS